MSVKQQGRDRDGLSHNEQLILQAIGTLIPITHGLLALEQHLYSLAETLPRPVFKQFRTLRDHLEDLFALVSGCTSQELVFNEEKEVLIQEQIKLMEVEVNRKPIHRERPPEGRPRSHMHPSREQQQWRLKAELLERELQSLKNELRRNDSQYEVEIKKYNYKYQEMQQEIDYYQTQSQQAREYLEAIQQLEVEVRALREARVHDQQLVQNMARKLRNMERDRFGHGAFLSPKKASFNSSFIGIQPQLSPKSRIYSREE